MSSTLFTKRQTLSIIYGWGYAEGNLPTSTDPGRWLGIPKPLQDTATNAYIEYGPKNRTGQRLYRITFKDLR